MATSILESRTSSNAYLDHVLSLPEDERQASTWLIITHDDPRLVQKIQDAMVGEQAVLLQIPQSHWKRDRGLLTQAIRETLRNSAVTQVAVVGHSQASAAECQSQVVGTTSCAQESVSDQSYQRLMIGLQNAQAQREFAKAEVVEQFQHFCAASDDFDTEGDIKWHAFFYMAESGLFLKFDSQAGRFESQVQN